MKTLFNVVTWAAAGVILAIVVFSFMQPPISGIPIVPDNQTAGAPNAPLPNVTATPPVPESGIDIILIDAIECSECINGTTMMEEISAYLEALPGIKVDSATTLERSGPQAQAFIAEYDITQVPALIVTGKADYGDEFTTTWIEKVGTLEPDGTYVSRMIPPPYFDIVKGRVVGLVRGITIEPQGCPDCVDPAGFFGSLEDRSIAGVYFTEKTMLEENSSEAQALIARYNITKLPTAIVDAEIEAYPLISQIANLEPAGDGWYIVRRIRPPYVDLADNHSVRGLVQAVLIVNSSCGDCLDINAVSDSITFPNGVKAVALTNKTTYEADSEEGRALLARYGITAIPTVLYSPEISLYQDFDMFWSGQNSTVESDGWHVFRSHALTGLTYQNVSG